MVHGSAQLCSSVMEVNETLLSLHHSTDSICSKHVWSLGPFSRSASPSEVRTCLKRDSRYIFSYIAKWLTSTEHLMDGSRMDGLTLADGSRMDGVTLAALCETFEMGIFR